MTIVRNWRPNFMVLIPFSSVWDRWPINSLFPTILISILFFISCLKKVIGTKFQTQTNILKLDEEGSIWLQPQAVLDQRECHMHHQSIKEVLVQWKYTTLADATWEPTIIL
jgi:hypothetical protein